MLVSKKDVATHMVDSEIVIGVRHFDFALGLVFDILDDNSVRISKGSLTKPTLEKCSGNFEIREPEKTKVGGRRYRAVARTSGTVSPLK
jgi:hypothetical protein